MKKQDHLHKIRRFCPRTKTELQQEVIDHDTPRWTYILSPTLCTDLVGGVLFHFAHKVYSEELQQEKFDAASTYFCLGLFLRLFICYAEQFCQEFFAPEIAPCAYFDYKIPAQSRSISYVK